MWRFPINKQMIKMFQNRVSFTVMGMRNVSVSSDEI